MFQPLLSGLYKTWHLATRSTHPLGSLLTNDQRGGFEQREAATKTNPNENERMTILETDSAPMANLSFRDQIFNMGNIEFKL